MYRSDICCPEDGGDVDEQRVVRHVPSHADPVHSKKRVEESRYVVDIVFFFYLCPKPWSGFEYHDRSRGGVDIHMIRVLDGEDEDET